VILSYLTIIIAELCPLILGKSMVILGYFLCIILSPAGYCINIRF